MVIEMRKVEIRAGKQAAGSVDPSRGHSAF